MSLQGKGGKGKGGKGGKGAEPEDKAAVEAKIQELPRVTPADEADDLPPGVIVRYTTQSTLTGFGLRCRVRARCVHTSRAHGEESARGRGLNHRTSM